MNFIKKNGAGLLLCLIIAIPSWFLGQSDSRHRRSGIRHTDRNDTYPDPDKERAFQQQASIIRQKKSCRQP